MEKTGMRLGGWVEGVGKAIVDELLCYLVRPFCALQAYLKHIMNTTI